MLKEGLILKHAIVALAKAILGGILIGIAGSIYLMVTDYHHIVGALLFGFGLLVICANGYNLFTGKVAYILDRKPKYLIDIIIIIIGNLIGAGLVAIIIKMGNPASNPIWAELTKTVDYKLSLLWYESFFLAIGCGALMYLAVDGYSRNKSDLSKTIIVILAVVIFILAKFEHSVADMFYFTLAGVWNWQALGTFLIILFGNAVGAFVLHYLDNLIKKYNDEKDEEIQ